MAAKKRKYNDMINDEIFCANGYKFIDSLKSGTFGIVYKAEKQDTNKIVAIKCISRENLNLEEINILNSIQSPYLIKLEADPFFYMNFYCIVTEFCKNGSLSDEIERKKNENEKFNYDKVYEWSKHIILGLDYLHSRDIIHRDIKPANILLNDEFKVKLADFGISRHVDTDTLTEMQGTLIYMSPEIREFSTYDYKTDIWSAGCVIFELIKLENFADFIASSNIQEEFRLQSNLKELIKRMLIKNVSDRASAAELKETFPALDAQTNETSLELCELNFSDTFIPPSYLPAKTSTFVGRTDILNKIKRYLEQDGKKIGLISSFAGTGKTTIANEFGHYFKQKNKLSYAYWLKSDENNLDDEFQQLANYFLTSKELSQIKNTIDLIKKINNRIHANKDSKILFIFDNCDKYETIEKYLTNLPNNACCLITTRKNFNESLNEKNFKYFHLHLEPFNQKECISLMKESLGSRITSQSDEKILLDIIKAVGFEEHPIRPFVLTKLIAYIKLEIGALKPIKSFLAQLTNLNKIHNEIIYKDDQLFVSLIGKDFNSWEILKLSSFLDPDFIPLEIYTDYFKINIDDLNKSVTNLQELSIMNVDYRHDIGLKIHRSLQSEIQQYLKTNSTNELIEIIEKLTFLTLDLLHNESLLKKGPKRNYFYYQIKKLVEMLTFHDHVNNSKKIEFSSKYGDYLNNLEKYEEALRFMNFSLDLQLQIEDNNSRKAADTMNYIGVINMNLGDSQKALDRFHESLKIKRHFSQNQDDANIAITLNNIGLAHNKLGDFRESLKYYEESLAIKRNFYQSDNHQCIAITLNNIGYLYQNLGEFEKSRDYYLQSLKINENLNSNENNPNIATIKLNIGIVYDYLENYVEAKRYVNETLNLLRECIYDNDECEKISTALNCLGRVSYHLNEFDDALNNLNKALKINKKISSEMNETTADILNNIGLVKMSQQDRVKAEDNFMTALDIYEQIYANKKESLKMAETCQNIGDLYIEMKKELALNYYNKALDIYNKINPNNFTNPINYITDKIKNISSFDLIETNKSQK